MTPILVLSILVLYFAALILISVYTSKGATSDTFFTANRQSPWYLVAFGMIGSSLSGITFVSVPGSVGTSGFAYFQVVLGYLLGYWVIITVLMPMYYRLNLVSIYTYLEHRFDRWSYKTGAFFCLLSRTVGSSLRLYLSASILQLFLFDAWNVPFFITVAITIFLIWIYTFKGCIKTIVWTDSFQTIFLVTAVVISVAIISNRLGFSFSGLVSTVFHSDYSKVFHFEDSHDKLFFWKQFFGGTFIAIAMTGLDQDLMQKNIVHLSFSVLILIIILIVKEINQKSLIDAVLGIAGYTYGPLLGLFSFGLFTTRRVRDKFVPFICILSPILSYGISSFSEKWFDGYKIGIEILIVNGLITFLGLFLISTRR